MPIYDYKCPCGAEFERFLKMADYQAPQVCDCGLYATRVIKPTMINGPMEAYECPVTGKIIHTRQQHEDNLKRHGCHVLESGEKEAAARVRAESNRELYRKIEETVDQLVDTLPEDKKAQLAQEMTLIPE